MNSSSSVFFYFSEHDDIEPSPRDRINSLEVKLQSKQPEPNIPENISEELVEDQRARSFTDSEGFYEEVKII